MSYFRLYSSLFIRRLTHFSSDSFVLKRLGTWKKQYIPPPPQICSEIDGGRKDEQAWQENFSLHKSCPTPVNQLVPPLIRKSTPWKPCELPLLFRFRDQPSDPDSPILNLTNAAVPSCML